MSLICVFLWVLLVWGQDTSQYGGQVRLEFYGEVQSYGQCQRLAQNIIACQVPTGSQGQIKLRASVSPSALMVLIDAVSLPGWASFSPASGFGTAVSSCTFLPSATSVGQTFQMVFRAKTSTYGLSTDFTVILEVIGGRPESTGQGYGPYPGVTDEGGHFSIPIFLPNTYVTGRATVCGKRPLLGASVSVTLVPKPGVSVIRALVDIGGVRVSSPGYGEQVMTQLRFASSMDISGRTFTTVELGDVCLMPTIVTTEPLSVTSDEEGKFSLSLPFPNTVAEGRLTECGERPLPNQPFSITPLPKGDVITSPEDIGGFTVSMPGYEEKTITKVNRFSVFGLTSYLLGDVCLKPLPPPKLILLEVAQRSFAPVYFQQQTVDELLRFRIEAPAGSSVERLSARLKPLYETAFAEERPENWVPLPFAWLGKDRGEIVEVKGWAWELPIPFAGKISTFNKLEVSRHDRVDKTPINEDTFFRVQEKELDKLLLTPGDVAIGYWEMEADIVTPDGRPHRIRSESREEVEARFTYRDGRKTLQLARVPPLYQVFSHKIDVYELGRSYDIALPSSNLSQPTAQHNCGLAPEKLEMRKEITQSTIDLFAKVDFRKWAPSFELLRGGSYMVIGNPFDLADPRNAEISTRSFHVCPEIEDDDLPREGSSDVNIVPPFGRYGGEVTLEHGLWTKLAQDLLVEFIPMILTGGIPSALSEFGEWGINKMVEIGRDKATEGLKEEKPTVMEAYAGVYQAVFSEMGDPTPYRQGLTALVPPKTKTEGWLGFDHQIQCHWSSLGRPRYRMGTGAAVVVIVMGKADKIKNFLSTAGMNVKLSEQGITAKWVIQDDSAPVGADRSTHDPNPDSTWE